MRRIVIPGTSIATSRLGFGTASLHHKLTSRQRQALLGAAFDAGIRHFDTAPYYGHEMAERELGRFLQSRRGAVTVATKAGIAPSASASAFPALVYWRMISRRLAGRLRLTRARADRPPQRFDPHYIVGRLERSLRLLRTDHVDLFFLHEPASGLIADPENLAMALERLRQQGKVRAFGLAGGAESCLAVAGQVPGLAPVLQVDVDPATGGVAAVHRACRPVQVTFGHFRNQAAIARTPSSAARLADAQRVNPDGLILFSSRSEQRIRGTAAAMGEH